MRRAGYFTDQTTKSSNNHRTCSACRTTLLVLSGRRAVPFYTFMNAVLHCGWIHSWKAEDGQETPAPG